VENAANWVTVLGFPAALVGLFFVYLQRQSDGLAASAAAINTVYGIINSRVSALENCSDTDKREKIYKDLLNDIELACALYLDGQFRGRTGDLSYGLLKDILAIIESDAELRETMLASIHADNTFRNITEFLSLSKNVWPAPFAIGFLRCSDQSASTYTVS